MTQRRDRALPRAVRWSVGWRAAAGVAWILVGVAVSGTSASAAGATLKLTPAQGTPAQVIQADGAGFCGDPAPACGTVSISFQGYGDVVRGITVSSSGTFSVHFQPPAGPPGDRTVTATQNNANGKTILAVTTFKLVLQPSLSPPPRPAPPSSTPPPKTPAPGASAPPGPVASASPSPSSAPEAAPNPGGGPPAAGAGAGALASLGFSSWLVGLLLVVSALAVAAMLWLRLRLEPA